MPFDSLPKAVRAANSQAYALDKSVHVTSDGSDFYVEDVDARWAGFQVVMTVVPTHLARRA